MSRALLVLLTAALLLGAGCEGLTPRPQPTPTPLPPTPAPVPTLPADGRIPVADPAIHVFLWGNAATTDRDLRLAAEGGFAWVKQRFEWRNVERDGKGQLQWEEPDRIVNAISARGLRVIARLDNQPRWASSRVTFPGSGPPDRLEDWTDYVSALATRYRGKIQAYEIWNEPNIAREWGGRAPDPAEYTRMLQASYAAIKAADPQALVVTAGMSPTTESSANAMPDLAFYSGMYAAGARGSYDVLGAHAAGFKAPPCADPDQVAADPALTNGDPSPPEARRVYAFRHIEDVRALMEANGDGGKQIGILEMGWTTDRRPDSPYAWHQVSEQEQARYLVDAFSCARERWAPWAAFLTVIYIADPGWTPQMEQFWWSVTNPNGTPRPAYEKLKELLRS